MAVLTQERVGESASLVRFRIRADESDSSAIVMLCDGVVLAFAVLFLAGSAVSEPREAGSARMVLPVVFVLLLRTACARARVREESMTLMPELGVELRSVSRDGSERVRFIDWVRVRAIVIYEAFEWNAVSWRMGLLLTDDERTAIAFKHLNPRLRTLVTIYRAAHTVLFGESGRPAEATDGVGGDDPSGHWPFGPFG